MKKFSPSGLEEFRRPFQFVEALRQAMGKLEAAGLTELPEPGGGSTIDRWRALASVASIDLPLAKIYEGHADAPAILAELKGERSPGLWAVWAAEPPQPRVIFRGSGDGGTISGQKPWCSGVSIVDHAIVSGWTEEGQPILIAVSLRQPGVSMDLSQWEAVGMSASCSGSVTFDQVPARAIGKEGDYVARPGFWQGGAGIAAVWYGGAIAIARALADSARIEKDAHAAAHLGVIDCALRSARALLIETASWIDAHPVEDASAAALRLRSCVETAANEVLLRTGRALGPGPLCMNAAHAQRCADLAVFLRQSHAEHDLAALGRTLNGNPSAWKF